MSGPIDTVPPDDDVGIKTSSYNPFFVLLTRKLTEYLRQGDYTSAQELLNTAAKYVELIYTTAHTAGLAGASVMHPYLFAAGIVGSSIPIPAGEGSGSETGWQNTGFTTLGIVTKAQAAYTALLGMSTAVTALSSGTDPEHPADLTGLYNKLAAAMTTTGVLVAGQLALGALESLRSELNDLIKRVDHLYYSQAAFVMGVLSDDPVKSDEERKKIQRFIDKTNKDLKEHPNDPKRINNLIYYHALLGNFGEVQKLMTEYIIKKKIPLRTSFGGYSLLFILYQAKSRNPALKSFDIFDLLDKVGYRYTEDMQYPVDLAKSDYFAVIAKDTSIGIYAGIITAEFQQAILGGQGSKAIARTPFAIHAGPIQTGLGDQAKTLSRCFTAVLNALENPASKHHELCVNILKTEGIKLIKTHMILVLKDVFERLAKAGLTLKDNEKRELFNNLLISVGNILILDPYHNLQALRDQSNQDRLKEDIFALLNTPGTDISKVKVEAFDKILKDICSPPSTRTRLGS